MDSKAPPDDGGHRPPILSTTSKGKAEATKKVDRPTLVIKRKIGINFSGVDLSKYRYDPKTTERDYSKLDKRAKRKEAGVGPTTNNAYGGGGGGGNAADDDACNEGLKEKVDNMQRLLAKVAEDVEAGRAESRKNKDDIIAEIRKGNL